MQGLTLRQMGIETLRAAIVLALVFLSFAHAPVLATGDDAPTVLTAAIDQSWCGETPDSDSKAHSPCHACRLGAAADLPPPCDAPAPAVVVADVAFGALTALQLPATPLGHATARGPPRV